MTSPRLFSTGTVAVTAGSKRVVLTGALVAEINFTDGDDLQVLANGSRLAIDVLLPDLNAFDLLHPFDGATDSAAPYTIYRNPSGWGSQRKLSMDVSEAVRVKVDQVPFTAEQLAIANAASATSVTARNASQAAAVTSTEKSMIASAAADAAAASAASILEVEAASFANRPTYLTWPTLAAIAGSAGAAAEVSAADNGTHSGYTSGTDALAVGLPNAGIYVWSVPLGAWRRVYSSSMTARTLEYGASITSSTGADILPGDYLMTPAAPKDGFFTGFFAQVTGPVGNATVRVLQNGTLLHGPVTLGGDTLTVSAVLAAPVAAGDELSVYVDDIISCTGLWVQVSGGN